MKYIHFKYSIDVPILMFFSNFNIKSHDHNLILSLYVIGCVVLINIFSNCVRAFYIY